MATTSSRHESLLNQTTPRPPGRRPRRLVVVALIVLGSAGVAAGGVVLALAHRPGFHATRGSHTPDPAAARRFITKVASLHDAASRSGPWDMALTEQECNAWLADDLPRNHPGLLPDGVVEPRVRLGPGRVDIAATLTEVWPLPAWLTQAIRPVVSLRLEVRLAAVGRLECRLATAQLGAIPLPKGAPARGGGPSATVGPRLRHPQGGRPQHACGHLADGRSRPPVDACRGAGRRRR